MQTKHTKRKHLPLINTKTFSKKGNYITRITLIFSLVLLFNSSFLCANSNEFKWPKHKISPIFEKFILAYNSNDLKKLNVFTKKYHKESEAEKTARYWFTLFYEFEEIVPFQINNDWTSDKRMAVWLQGKKTKGWVMVILSTNDEKTQILRKSVVRGIRPSGTLPPYKSLSDKELKSYLKKYLQELEKMDYFSGAVLVAKGNKILFQKAYGLRDEKLNKKNNLNTIFNLASTTKTFTAVAIAQLAEKRKLSYTDPISKFIPEYPKDIADQVSIHHLLTHTSGIELDDYQPFNEAERKAKNIEELLKAQLKYLDHMNEGRRKDFKVLNKHDYSNENFSLLGVIIERVSGMSYARYIEEFIFKPAGMTNSISDAKKLASNNNKAMGYTYRDKEHNYLTDKIRRENKDIVSVTPKPAGGIYSSVKDLYNYYKAINQHKIVNAKTQELLHKKHIKGFSFGDATHDYGYGFEIISQGKAKNIGHGGTHIGVGSKFDYYPEQDIYVIVLALLQRQLTFLYLFYAYSIFTEMGIPFLLNTFKI